jgi:hypothetical protein
MIDFAKAAWSDTKRGTIFVDERRWWVVRHLDGYAYWDDDGKLFVTPHREMAQQFSSARLAQEYADAISEDLAPMATAPVVVCVSLKQSTMTRSRRGP